MGHVVELVDAVLDRRHLVSGKGPGERVEHRADLLGLRALQEVGVREQGAFCGVAHALGFHLRLGEPAPLEVVLAVVEGIEQHLLHLRIVEAVGWLDLHRLLDSGRRLAGCDVQEAVGVDAKAHLQTSKAGRHGRDPLQREARERAAIARQLAFTLHDVQLESRLVVGVGREGRLRARGNAGISGQDLVHPATHGLDPERQRKHVQEQDFVTRARQEVCLNRCTVSHHQIRIDIGQRLFTE
jgi:hypothetical protein